MHTPKKNKKNQQNDEKNVSKKVKKMYCLEGKKPVTAPNESFILTRKRTEKE